MDLVSSVQIFSLVCILGFCVGYALLRDVLHPACIGSLLALVSIGGSWLALSSHDLEAIYPSLEFASSVNYYTACYLFFLAGTLLMTAGSRRKRMAVVVVSQPEPRRAKEFERSAYLLAAAAGLVYFLQLRAGGGFIEIYSQVKGKGDLGSGLNDFIYLGVPASVLYFLSIRGRKMRLKHWIILALMLSPLLLSGILSSRRGPTAMGMGALFFGFCVTRGYRPPLVSFFAAAAFGGAFLIFLVAFREDIYLGSNILSKLSYDTVAHRMEQFVSKPAPGHEFIYSSRVMLSAEYDQDFWFGLRYLLATTIWLVPSFLFPNKYATLGAEGMNYNGGTAGRDWSESINAPGAAPMFFADAYVEFGDYAVLFVLIIGLCFGAGWNAMRRGELDGQILYVCALALLVYLFSQNFTAFAQRFIVMALPAIFLLKSRIFYGRKARNRTAVQGVVQSHNEALPSEPRQDLRR